MKVSELLEILSELSPDAEVPLSVTAMLSNEAETTETLKGESHFIGEMKWTPAPYTSDGTPPPKGRKITID